jgi:hypothetical protein
MASMESILTPAFFRDLRAFWFENLENLGKDNVLVNFTSEQQSRWFHNGKGIDAACE